VTQEKVVRVVGYYRDPSYIERVAGAFRKLLMDINWIQGRKVSDDGLYEIYLGVPYTNNFDIAIQNLSKTVDIEKVDVLEDAVVTTYVIKRDGSVVRGEPFEAKEYDIVVFKPSFSKVTTLSWGSVSGKNIY
jgi:acetolactate synthase regulatory subunit